MLAIDSKSANHSPTLMSQYQSTTQEYDPQTTATIDNYYDVVEFCLVVY